MTRTHGLSIVICTRNRARRIEQCFDAVARLRGSVPFEVVWVDNNSTDETANVLKSLVAQHPNMRYEWCGQVGLGAARDFGWRTASYDIIALTDDDCYPEPGFVDGVMAAFKSWTEAGCIGGRILLHDPRHAPVIIDEGTIARSTSTPVFLEPGYLQGANLAFRRVALERSGGFDSELGAGTAFPCEDIDAAAAVLWAGFSVVFDPGFAVRHDHGRTEKDIPPLRVAYSRGAGAYYAKYLLRKDSRGAYARGWLKKAWNRRWWYELDTLLAEARSALAYLRMKRRYVFLAAGSSIGACVLVVLGARMLLGALWRRAGRRQQ